MLWVQFNLLGGRKKKREDFSCFQIRSVDVLHFKLSLTWFYKENSSLSSLLPSQCSLFVFCFVFFTFCDSQKRSPTSSPPTQPYNSLIISFNMLIYYRRSESPFMLPWETGAPSECLLYIAADCFFVFVHIRVMLLQKHGEKTKVLM